MQRRLLAMLAIGALALTGCSDISERDKATAEYSSNIVRVAQPEVADSAATGSTKVKPGAKLTGPRALNTLNSLPVKGKAPATGYSRNGKFGNGWKDFDNDKCDERQDTLSRDMSKVKFKDRKKCTLRSGTLHDAYTGKRINWKAKSGSVDIDHVVALKNAWISGGQKLSQSQRQALANDPLNLMASSATANRQKGGKDAAEWLPKNKTFRCQYVATQISVKKKYALSVTKAEKNAIAMVLNSCKSQKAAKVKSIKPGGSKDSSKPKAPKKIQSHYVKGTVHPGAYCKGADKGKKGRSKAGKTYTCKGSKTDSRLRWRV
ncbi:HNH endonuclease family protein [Glutamicibacter arilaitensis]|uniref:HNH endonuclease family protein n=1 Tax=Glutamicibacter arilaitensis TaxID=256701 RepID=UPI00384C2C71